MGVRNGVASCLYKHSQWHSVEIVLSQESHLTLAQTALAVRLGVFRQLNVKKQLLHFPLENLNAHYAHLMPSSSTF